MQLPYSNRLTMIDVLTANFRSSGRGEPAAHFLLLLWPALLTKTLGA